MNILAKGYIEDTHIPKLLRDAQVLPIWEGTSTVMSLDVLRSIQKSSGSVLEALIATTAKMIEVEAESELAEASGNVRRHLSKVVKFVKSSSTESMIHQLKSARDFSFAIGRLYQAALLVDHARFTQNPARVSAILQKADFSNFSGHPKSSRYLRSRALCQVFSS